MRKYKSSGHTIYALLVLLTGLMVNPALAGPGDPEAARQAWPMIEQGALLIDVRTSEEFSQGHIEGALNIPFQATDQLMQVIGDDKQRPVVVYCRSGNRSGQAKVMLEKHGYTHVFNATGYVALKQTKP